MIALHVRRVGGDSAEVRQGEALLEVGRGPAQPDRQRTPSRPPACNLAEVGRRGGGEVRRDRTLERVREGCGGDRCAVAEPPPGTDREGVREPVGGDPRQRCGDLGNQARPAIAGSRWVIEELRARRVLELPGLSALRECRVERREVLGLADHDGVRRRLVPAVSRVEHHADERQYDDRQHRDCTDLDGGAHDLPRPLGARRAFPLLLHSRGATRRFRATAASCRAGRSRAALRSPRSTASCLRGRAREELAGLRVSPPVLADLTDEVTRGAAPSGSTRAGSRPSRSPRPCRRGRRRAGSGCQWPRSGAPRTLGVPPSRGTRPETELEAELRLVAAEEQRLEEDGGLGVLGGLLGGEAEVLRVPAGLARDRLDDVREDLRQRVVARDPAEGVRQDGSQPP